MKKLKTLTSIALVALLLILVFVPGSLTISANEPPAFTGWAKSARLAGAALWIEMTDSEINNVLTNMVNQNVTVIEADSNLSEYLNDTQFAEELTLITRVSTLAHAKGLKVVWYYPSLEVITTNGETLPNSMYKDHPDWVQYDMSGAANVFYGSVVFWVPPGAESAWMCPNSGYRDYIYARVAQIAATGVDGLWMDVPLLNDIVLQWTDTNPAAVAAFLADTGLAVPTTADWSNLTFRKWVAWRHQQIDDYLTGMRAVAAAVTPDFPIFVETVTMDYNAATGIALDGSTLKNDEGITQVWELDAISDDTGMRNAQEDDWISMIAMNKFARAASGTKPAWMFGYGKQADDAELVMAEILAAGNNYYETKIPEMATSVGPSYRTKMFGWIKDNSTYLYDRQTAAKVAIYYSSPSRDYVDQNGGVGLYATTTKPAGLTSWWSEAASDSAYSRQYLAEFRGIVKAMVHSHIPFDVIVEPDQAELSKYESIVLPDLEAISAAKADLIRQYVSGGGHIVITGPNPTGMDEYGTTLANYLLADVLGFNKGSASIPQHTFGAGECRYFATLPGKNYFVTSDAASLTQLQTAIQATSESLLTTNADRRVHFELSYSGENTMVLQMVNFIGVTGTFSVVPTSFDVTLAIPAGKQIQSVALTSPDNPTSALQPVSFTQDLNNLTFNTNLTEYSLLVITLAARQYVTSIEVTGSDHVTRNQSIQMAATVLPASAGYKAVNWSVTPGTGSGSIDADGLFSGTSVGTVTVTATAADGTGVFGSKAVTVDEIGCTVTFNSQGGSVVAPVNTPINTAIAAPTPAPTKSGYTFGGWYKESACTNAWNFSSELVTTDVTLYAKWTVNAYSITFNSAGGSAVSSITQNYGTAITPPANPTRTGYTFYRWNPAIPATMPAGGATLTAEWTINQYTITFDSAGGSTVASITQNYGTAVASPADPTRAGCVFTGWFPAVPATMPAGGAALTAQWTLISTPQTITSSVYSCNATSGYISKINMNTSVASLLDGLNEKQYIRIFKDAAEVSGSVLTSTGMVARLMNGESVQQTLTIVVTGDVSGDGQVTLTDFVKTKSHLLGLSSFTGPYFKASDINGDGGVTLTDFVKMKSHLLGIELITPKSY